ncbi:MAG: hypothetical protein ABIW84_06280 [Ilumatobacteraceae bacterium]
MRRLTTVFATAAIAGAALAGATVARAGPSRIVPDASTNPARHVVEVEVEVDDVVEVVGGGITAVAPGVGAGASATLVNLTMVDGAAPGYVTADRCSALVSGPKAQSTGNHGVRAAVSNLAVVALDADGRFCIYNQSSVSLLADVQGYFAGAAEGGKRFVASAPARVLDTRGSVRPGAGTITTVSTGLAPGTAAAMVNITMVGAAMAGYVTADRCSTLAAGPQARSSGNHGVAVAVANLSVVPLEPDGTFCIYNQVSVDLVVDVQGAFIANAADSSGFASVAPRRVLDTRVGEAGRPPAGTVTKVAAGVGLGAVAALVNLAMVNGAGPGFVTAGSCSTIKAGAQTHSNSNHTALAAASNLAVIALDGDGSFCLYNQVAVDLVVDVQGSFNPNASEQFFTVAPRRVLDTRPPPSALPMTSCTSVVHIGDSTSVGLISPSYLPDPALRVDAQYRRVGVTDPRMEISGARSIVETLSGQVNARDTAAAIKATGYEGCWVLALGTTDTANIAAGSGPGRRERIDRMMAVIGDDPVLWVNVRTAVGGDDFWSNANMQLWNQALTAAAPSFPNLHVYDWSAVMNPTWFSGDRIHYTSDGYAQRGRLIADALAAELPTP